MISNPPGLNHGATQKTIPSNPSSVFSSIKWANVFHLIVYIKARKKKCGLEHRRKRMQIKGMCVLRDLAYSMHVTLCHAGVPGSPVEIFHFNPLMAT